MGCYFVFLSVYYTARPMGIGFGAVESLIHAVQEHRNLMFSVLFAPV